MHKGHFGNAPYSLACGSNEQARLHLHKHAAADQRFSPISLFDEEECEELKRL
jgi:hypothetical protein